MSISEDDTIAVNYLHPRMRVLAWALFFPRRHAVHLNDSISYQQTERVFMSSFACGPVLSVRVCMHLMLASGVSRSSSASPSPVGDRRGCLLFMPVVVLPSAASRLDHKPSGRLGQVHGAGRASPVLR